MNKKAKLLSLRKRVIDETADFSPEVRAFLYGHLRAHLNNISHRDVSWYINITPNSVSRIYNIYEHQLRVLRRYRLFDGVENLYMPADALDLLMFKHDHCGREVSGIVEVLRRGHIALLQPVEIDASRQDWASNDYLDDFCMRAPAHFNANGGSIFDDELCYSQDWQIPRIVLTSRNDNNRYKTKNGNAASIYLPGMMRNILRPARAYTTEIIPVKNDEVERLRG